jgi:hypothetical protein
MLRSRVVSKPPAWGGYKHATGFQHRVFKLSGFKLTGDKELSQSRSGRTRPLIEHTHLNSGDFGRNGIEWNQNMALQSADFQSLKEHLIIYRNSLEDMERQAAEGKILAA